MRVANVQDGKILTDDIKSIEVLPSDVEKYLLKKGDILLTAPNPDKNRDALLFDTLGLNSENRTITNNA